WTWPLVLLFLGILVCGGVGQVLNDAQTLGIERDWVVIIAPVDYLMLWLASAIGSIGVGPVPSTGLVLIMTVWKTVFSGVALPAAFGFVMATDWFLDRLETLVNVTCDTVVCRVVAESVGDTDEKNQERNLEEGGLQSTQTTL
ncbi:hypothetical protein BBJ28_00021421, partial [Nothophytophthora sp. Chile5]